MSLQAVQITNRLCIFIQYFQGEMYAVYPSWQFAPARITAFIQFLTDRLSV